MGARTACARSEAVGDRPTEFRAKEWRAEEGGRARAHRAGRTLAARLIAAWLADRLKKRAPTFSCARLIHAFLWLHGLTDQPTWDTRKRRVSSFSLRTTRMFLHSSSGTNDPEWRVDSRVGARAVPRARKCSATAAGAPFPESTRHPAMEPLFLLYPVCKISFTSRGRPPAAAARAALWHGAGD